MKKINWQKSAVYNGFSLAEALITLLVVCVITIASVPVITKKHRAKFNLPHGVYACYWNGDNLVAKYSINGKDSDGKVVYDSEEGRYACEFNPPTGAKNFVATIVGGGGGGAGAGAVVSSSSKIYTEPGNYTYTTPDSGLYKMLAVGGGGGGGDGNYIHRACTASTGGLAYVPFVFLAKDINLSVAVGNGGAAGVASTDGSKVGGRGGDSSIKNTHNNVNYATATGGWGGCSFYWKQLVKPRRNFTGYLSKFTISETEWGKPNGPSVLTGSWSTYAQGIYSGQPGIGYSMMSNAQTSEGVFLGPLTSTDHQNNKDKYNLLSKLSNYSDKFGVNFNSVTQRTNNLICQRGTWEKKAICKKYENHYGAGGGGGGQYNTSSSESNYDSIAGIGGFVGISYTPVYAGLGGEAGKVTQVPYAEMPQKTLLFPGKGGKGGQGAGNIRRKMLTSGQYQNNEVTMGLDGQPSYIKNGAHILQGSGAAKIVPKQEDTYSNAYNDDGMPVGQNGQLSDILTNKKTGTGGLGGMTDGNPSLDGTTQVMFQDGKEISSFNQIYGAGAGGGGGALSVDENGNIAIGNGGDGSSGLVFIQW